MLSSPRNAEEDEEHFDMCLRSLEEEIMYNAGHLLTVEEPPKEVEEQPEPRKPRLKKKPGRAFCRSLSKLYMQDLGSHGNINKQHHVPKDVSKRENNQWAVL